LELRYHALADVLALLLVLGHISGKGIENRDSSPFRAFVQRNKKFVEDGGGNDEYTRV
jgi:hypothetical protein